MRVHLDDTDQENQTRNLWRGVITTIISLVRDRLGSSNSIQDLSEVTFFNEDFGFDIPWMYVDCRSVYWVDWFCTWYILERYSIQTIVLSSNSMALLKVYEVKENKRIFLNLSFLLPSSTSAVDILIYHLSPKIQYRAQLYLNGATQVHPPILHRFLIKHFNQTRKMILEKNTQNWK